MKKDLFELKEIEDKIKSKFNYINDNSNLALNNINEVKILKNDIFEKTSKTFIYNLTKLIQLELTQKNLAKKIAISEDLLSKYKAGVAFPSIETLIYICSIYNLSIEELIATPLTTADIEALGNNEVQEYTVFEEKYYVYFLVTSIGREGTIHEGVVEICKDKVIFNILSGGEVIKCFTGNYSISDKLIYFNLQSLKQGITYINMIKPNVNKNKYLGGLAMMLLASDANSKPCAQKLLFSKVRLDRQLYYNNLRELLSFCVEGVTIGHIKISQGEDEIAYNFIRKLG
ncbi:MAG TPA: helix-turn-helix transcriptional regulator [Clostridiaceae bacterium]